MGADMKTSFWVDRSLLMCLIYCAMEGNKHYFVTTLAAVILHDFIVFMVKRPLMDLYALLLTLLNNFKYQKSGTTKQGYYKSVRERGEVESSTTVKKNKNDGEEEEQLVACGNCRVFREEEAMKAKGKYKDKYKRKLVQKEERFENVKSSLKDKYNEDREKWEEERKLFKKKYEELRWT